MESNVRTLDRNLGLSFYALGNFIHLQKRLRGALEGDARAFLAVNKISKGIKRGLVYGLGTKLLYDAKKRQK